MRIVKGENVKISYEIGFGLFIKSKSCYCIPKIVYRGKFKRDLISMSYLMFYNL